jgi:hypothetical protein
MEVTTEVAIVPPEAVAAEQFDSFAIGLREMVSLRLYATLCPIWAIFLEV